MASNGLITIRRAVTSDVPKIFQMIKEHAEYSKELVGLHMTEEVLVRDGFGEKPWFQLLVAEVSERTNDHTGQKQIIGHAMYYQTYSAWKGKMLFVDDLYVLKQYRGKGAGAMLMREVAKIARDIGCYKVSWCVLNWNESAHGFYKSIGAEFSSQWHLYTLGNQAMLKLAEEHN